MSQTIQTISWSLSHLRRSLHCCQSGIRRAGAQGQSLREEKLRRAAEAMLTAEVAMQEAMEQE